MFSFFFSSLAHSVTHTHICIYLYFIIRTVVRSRCLSFVSVVCVVRRVSVCLSACVCLLFHLVFFPFPCCPSLRLGQISNACFKGTRTSKQCRARFMNHLDPSLRHSPWTFAENAALKASKQPRLIFGWLADGIVAAAAAVTVVNVVACLPSCQSSVFPMCDEMSFGISYTWYV